MLAGAGLGWTVKRSTVVVLADDLAVDGRIVARAGARLIGGPGWVVFNGCTLSVRTKTVQEAAIEMERRPTAREEEYQEAKP